MRTLHTLILSGTLTPCEEVSRKILMKIEMLQVPIIKCEAEDTSQNQSNMGYLHHRNKYTIKQIQDYLKKEFLNNIDIEEIFDSESTTYKVYSLLSKLDKIQPINSYYLQEANMSGLQHLSSALNSLLCD